MKSITWKLQYYLPPPAYRHCKKCGGKTGFKSSGRFRVNAQRRYLDIWLVYKCPECNTTWNAAVYSRISPQSLESRLLERFHSNDAALAEKYAMDIEFLHENGAAAGEPEYSVAGEAFTLGEALELRIVSEYSFPIKVSALIRKKLSLSQREFTKLAEGGRIKEITGQDLRKCRLNKGITLVFQ